MKYVMIFHANLNYAYLTPDRYEFVIRKSYELILDTMAARFPDVKFVFEASGYTLEEISRRCPDVLAKLKRAIDEGAANSWARPTRTRCCRTSPRKTASGRSASPTRRTRKHLGVAPRSFWNPECGWRHYVPRAGSATGYVNLIGDFEAYSRSCDAGRQAPSPGNLCEGTFQGNGVLQFRLQVRPAGHGAGDPFSVRQDPRRAQGKPPHVPPNRPHRAVRRAVFHGHEGLHVREVHGPHRKVFAAGPASRRARSSSSPTTQNMSAPTAGSG